MRSSTKLVTTVVLGLALFGCDKIKAAIGKGGGDDGGTVAASGGGGSVLSFLGSDFEGEITASLKSKSQSAQQVVFGIKKPKFRIEIAGVPGSTNPALAGGGSVILDPPSKKGWVLMPVQKMAMELDFDKMKSGKAMIPGMPSTPKVPTTPPKIDKTGKKDTVAGYSCDVWNITTSDNRKAEVCVAEGITWFDVSDLGMGSPELALAAVAADANRFPLRLISYDAAGAEDTRMEATKVEKKTLDASRFIVPPDYKTMDIGGLMGAMQGGMPGGMPSGMPGGPHGYPGHSGAKPKH